LSLPPWLSEKNFKTASANCKARAKQFGVRQLDGALKSGGSTPTEPAPHSAAPLARFASGSS
jgi:hypothetical protein